jgi:hypothetical protein
MRPKAIGRPGFMAIFQNSTSPSLLIMARVKSASPTDTPPLVMTASAIDAASRKVVSRAAGSSRTTPMSITSKPRRVSMPNRV